MSDLVTTEEPNLCDVDESLLHCYDVLSCCSAADSML